MAKGIPFTIVRTDIVVPECCPALGIALKVGDGAVADASPSLDRIVPELGYVPGNVAVISYKANRMKSNGTLAQHKALVAWLASKS